MMWCDIFFVKQKTAYDMRISDWSSDVCSSDLEPAGWFNKEIKTPEDFQGLKMRISGLGGKVINKLGASAQLIAGGELYVALERGRIEATEFSLPIIDKSTSEERRVGKE